MCGRFASGRDPDDLAVLFRATVDDVAAPSWNVAPTDPVRVVLERPNRADPEAPVRLLRSVRWGLVPSWARIAATWRATSTRGSRPSRRARLPQGVR